jgi:hypothetical protein
MDIDLISAFFVAIIGTFTVVFLLVITWPLLASKPLAPPLASRIQKIDIKDLPSMGLFYEKDLSIIVGSPQNGLSRTAEMTLDYSIKSKCCQSGIITYRVAPGPQRRMCWDCHGEIKD